MRYNDFSGGLNTVAAPYLLENNQARELLNVQSRTQGGIVKRDGLVTHATLVRPADVLTSLFALEATATDYLIGAGGTSLYSISTTGTVATRKTGVTRDLRWEWVQTQASGGQGPLFGMNGTDTPQQWDGVAATMSDWTASSGAVPNGKFVALHQNYVFVAGVAATPNRLYWCRVAPGTGTDPRDWPTTNLVDLDPNDGDEITGIGKAGPLLLIFKRRKIFAVFDAATGANRRISDSIGAVAHRSIVETPSGTMFLGETGIWRTNGSVVEATPVSRLIEPTLGTVALPTGVAGVYWNNHCYWSFSPDGRPNSLTLDYDLALGSWWLHSVGSNQFAIWRPTTAALYSAKAGAPIVDKCFVPGIAQDNGANYAWLWRGPWVSPAFYFRRLQPTPDYRKRLRQVRCDGHGRVDFSLARGFVAAEVLVKEDIFATDPAEAFGGSGTFGGTGTSFGGGTQVPLAKIYSLGVARAFSPVFGATSDAGAAVYSMTLFMTDRRT